MIDIFSDALFGLIALIAFVYGIRRYRHATRRLKAASQVGNGRLVLARGNRGATAWLLVVPSSGLLAAVVQGIRDVREVLAGVPEPFSVGGLVMRGLLTVMMFGAMGALWTQDRTAGKIDASLRRRMEKGTVSESLHRMEEADEDRFSEKEEEQGDVRARLTEAADKQHEKLDEILRLLREGR